jgi:hypothetical protein
MYRKHREFRNERYKLTYLFSETPIFTKYILAHRFVFVNRYFRFWRKLAFSGERPVFLLTGLRRTPGVPSPSSENFPEN